MFAIVMAGGAGTRLWPLSRRETPKQLLALTGDTSLLQQSVARLGAVLKPQDIYVITSDSHVRATRSQLPQLPEENVLGEPLARSTAVAAGLATTLARRESDDVALVLPADHFVADEGAFTDALREAAHVAERGYLVTLGVVPTDPATGYGYIKAGGRLHPSSSTALVERFVEKPDAERAAAFLAEGNYFWNAGVFVWRVYAFRQALERFQPALAGRARDLVEHRLDLLGAVTVADEERVRRVDDDEVLEADRDDEPIAPVDEHAMRVAIQVPAARDEVLASRRGEGLQQRGP